MFLGDVQAGLLGDLRAALSAAGSAISRPLVATAGPSLELLGRGLLVWPVAGLADLASAVSAATESVGARAPARPFVGHITVARSRYGADLRPYRTDLCVAMSASWLVERISLVESQLRPDGAVYREVALFSLPGAVEHRGEGLRQ